MSQPFLFKGKVQTRAFLPAPGMVREPPAREAVRGTSRYRCRGPRWRGPFFSGVPTHLQEQPGPGSLCVLAGLPANTVRQDAAMRVCMFPLSSH